MVATVARWENSLAIPESVVEEVLAKIEPLLL